MYNIQNKIENAQCRLGILIIENTVNKLNEEFIKTKQTLETSLCEKYASLSRSELKALHPMNAYVAYYKKFGYTYHVQGQLESIIKGKSIPSVMPLVEAMFMAELDNMLLTAGHDLDKADFPINLQTCEGNETFITMNGKEMTTVAKDCMITDKSGILSSILRGPDRRTAITKDTRRVIYTIYALPNIEDERVYNHLNDIEKYVNICSPDAKTAIMQIY